MTAQGSWYPAPSPPPASFSPRLAPWKCFFLFFAQKPEDLELCCTLCSWWQLGKPPRPCSWARGGQRGWFPGAGTQTKRVVLSVVLVQRPQDCLLGADGLQFRGSGHRAAEFLQLVFIPLCVLLEDSQTVGHVVLAGGSLAAKVGHEACKSRGNHSLQQGIQNRPQIPRTSAQPSPFLPGPATLPFPKGH